MMLPCVPIIFTGGTIAMRIDPTRGGAVPALSGADLVLAVPGLDKIAEIQVLDFDRLPGPHMTPARMLDLARVVEEQLARPEVVGVVITHGTDTLEETAYLLDLVLNSEKPAVLVGAMRNSSELGWDGPANLRDAVRVAADPATRGLGVLVAMGGQILGADTATKQDTAAPDTFGSRHGGPLGIVEPDHVLIWQRRERREHVPAPVALEERVEIVKLSAGSDGRLITLAIEAGFRGLVIEGLGRGNVPVTAMPAIERAASSGIPMLVTSRCPRGRVLDSYAYPGSGTQLLGMGLILAGMLSSQQARLKLMLLLGNGASLEETRRAFAP
jgi:L-asparaginase